MKTIIALSALLLFSLSARVQAQDPCYDLSLYHRNIPTSYLTWGFSNNTLGAKYSDGTSIPASDVSAAIDYAIVQWTSAANTNGTVITFEQVDYADAVLKIFFAAHGSDWGCGEAPFYEQIELNSNWRFASRGALFVTVMHEMGHVFLGSGHHGDGVMSCSVGGNCDIAGAGVSGNEAARTYDLYNQQYEIKVKNDFGNGVGGGSIVVDDTLHENIPADGKTFYWRVVDPSHPTHTIHAVDRQTVGDNYVRVYDKWTDKDGYKMNTEEALDFSVTVTGPAIYKAHFKKEYNVTFQNAFLGAVGGKVKVGTAEPIAPYVAPVKQYTSITVEAPYQVINGINHVFSHWTNQNNETISNSAQTEFAPTDHATYTAYYTASPNPPENIDLGGTDYVHITWTEHPHSDVTQYQIWRTIKPYNQNSQPPEHMATVNRGTTEYDDYEFAPIWQQHAYLLGYDVRSYYSLNGATSEPCWDHVYGVRLAKPTTALLPTAYDLQSYPNPFNPSTTISYQLPTDGMVKLVVLDVLGREVNELASGVQPAGYRSVRWDAAAVASGIYYARFTVTDGIGDVKYSKVTKLILMK